MLDMFSWNLKSVETSWILACWRWMPNNFMTAIPVTWCLPDTKQIRLVFWPISFRKFSKLEDVDLKLRGRTWPDSCASTETERHITDTQEDKRYWCPTLLPSKVLSTTATETLWSAETTQTWFPNPTYCFLLWFSDTPTVQVTNDNTTTAHWQIQTKTAIHRGLH